MSSPRNLASVEGAGMPSTAARLDTLRASWKSSTRIPRLPTQWPQKMVEARSHCGLERASDGGCLVLRTASMVETRGKVVAESSGGAPRPPPRFVAELIRSSPRASERDSLQILRSARRPSTGKISVGPGAAASSTPVPQATAQKHSDGHIPDAHSKLSSRHSLELPRREAEHEAFAVQQGQKSHDSPRCTQEVRYIKSQAKPARQTLDMGVFNNGRQQWFVKSTELGDSAMALILSSRALEDPGNNVDDVKGGRGKFAGRDADCKEFITVHTSRVKDEAPPGDLKDNPPRGNLQVEPTILELKARIRELESTVQELKSAVHEIKEPQGTTLDPSGRAGIQEGVSRRADKLKQEVCSLKAARAAALATIRSLRDELRAERAKVCSLNQFEELQKRLAKAAKANEQLRLDQVVKDGIIKRQSLELEAFRKAARLGLARSQGEFREDQGLQAAEDSTEASDPATSREPDVEEPRRAQANTTSGKSPVSPIKDVSCQDIVGTLSTTNNPPPRGNLLSPLGKIRRRRTPGITDAISTNPVFTQEGADSSIDGA